MTEVGAAPPSILQFSLNSPPIKTVPLWGALTLKNEAPPPPTEKQIPPH